MAAAQPHALTTYPRCSQRNRTRADVARLAASGKLRCLEGASDVAYAPCTPGSCETTPILEATHRGDERRHCCRRRGCGDRPEAGFAHVDPTLGSGQHRPEPHDLATPGPDAPCRPRPRLA